MAIGGLSTSTVVEDFRWVFSPLYILVKDDTESRQEVELG